MAARGGSASSGRAVQTGRARDAARPARSRARLPAIVVRRATTGDAAAYARIMGDPLVFPGLMQMPHASEEQWQRRLEKWVEDDRGDLLIVAERGGEVVGTAGLHTTGPAMRRRHVMYLGISVAADAQRQGVGSALMQAMVDYADRWAQVLRLELQVYADNAPAIALYRRFGFVVEGRHPGFAMRDGVYVESWSMGRLHPAAPALPSR